MKRLRWWHVAGWVFTMILCASLVDIGATRLGQGDNSGFAPIIMGMVIAALFTAAIEKLRRDTKAGKDPRDNWVNNNAQGHPVLTALFSLSLITLLVSAQLMSR